MSHPENETCSNCKYWEGKAEPNGECRINPPIVLLLDKEAGKTSSQWPATQSTDWCGQFVKAVSKAKPVKPYVEIRRVSPEEVLGLEP